MSLEDQYRTLISGYYGIQEMDVYNIKEFVLKDIEEYINNFLEINEIKNFNFNFERQLIKEKKSLKRKLQDSLYVLRLIDADLEIILLVKEKLRELSNK